MLGGVVAEALLNFGDVFGAFEIHAAEAERAIHEMDVAIDEAGQHELTRGVDYFGAGRAKFFNVGVVTDGDNFVGANRQRLRPGLFGVERCKCGREARWCPRHFCFLHFSRFER